jgi:DNA polymerase III subunit epsilon
MREIVLDTETTGLDPAKGHRLIEIGCVELVNHMQTGQTYHCYLNPERAVEAEAVAIHGLTDDFLRDKPVFPEIIGPFLDFIGDAPLIIHNAEFDMRFLNHELGLAGFAPLPANRAVDTVVMARRRFPGSPASLDALCRRFGIDNSSRSFHGALLDSQLLAEVYLELLGGRQPGLVLSLDRDQSAANRGGGQAVQAQHAMPAAGGPVRPARPHEATAEELAAHALMLTKLKDPLWTKLAGG